MKISTPVTRALAAFGVPYLLRVHGHDALTAETAARERGVRLSQIVKTMVVMRHHRRPMLALVPGHRRLDLRKLAIAVGERKVRLATPAEVFAVTGYTIGSVSLLGVATPDLSVVADREVLAEEMVDVSAGRPDAGVELRSSDLLRVVRATVGDIGVLGPSPAA